ncbi:MAG TPA: hypothetical protein VK918_06300 [Pyrinomonadaceae bacterium]|nr:hypothetical protein [Pyrinomonadaceae bacterium]
MIQGFISVPFKTETSHGLSQVNGIAKFSTAGIVLEFESKLLGLIAGGVKEVRLPLSEILDVTFKKGFFGRSAKIHIRTRTYTALAELPSNDGKLTLKLEKEDIERGRGAVEHISRDVREYEAELPPPQTPVSQLFEDETEDETRKLER